MDVTSFKSNLCSGSIEIFQLQFPYFATIHRIRPFAAKLPDIELMRTFTDFLIRIESDTNLSMFDFGMFFQINDCRYDLGNSRFIIRTKQRLAVCYNQILSFMIEQFRKLCRRKNDIFFGTKHYIRPIIVFYNTWSYIFSGHIGTCVHMSDKPDSGYFFIYISRKRGKKIAMFIQSNIFQPQRFQFSLQIFSEYHLFRSTGSKPCWFIRLCIKAHILQKSVY